MEYFCAELSLRRRIDNFSAKVGLSTASIIKILSEPNRGTLFLSAARDDNFWHSHELAASSGLFDHDYYQCQVSELDDLEPLAHYLIFGYRAFLDPSPRFSTAEYYLLNHDVRSDGANPLIHFLLHGRSEARFSSLADREERQASLSNYPIGLTLAEEIDLEIMRGASYLGRYGFDLDSSTNLHQATNAIKHLVARSPKLSIDIASPDVSIIVPVHGRLQILLNCLDAICSQVSWYSVEVVIVDDASPTESRVAEVKAIPWVRYLNCQQNLGFGASCNFGAASARGKYLMFLNNDTRILPRCVDELVGSFDQFPKAGLVGSKLINEDGSLQDAGGIVWRDGTVWNYGRNEPPERPEFCYARQVDYCSGASIVVSAIAWSEVGGFDRLYAPAYCEDLDLAYKLRQEGYEVWYQPLSIVLHYEGRSHGRDVTVGIKAHQTRNLKTFFQKWQHALGENGLPKPHPHAEANRTRRKHALVVDAKTPTPDRDSGSNNTFDVIRLLQQLGWQVAFAPRNHAFAGNYTKALQRIGVEQLIAPCISSLKDIVQNRLSQYDLIFAFRYESLDDWYDGLRTSYPRARLVFHDVDLHHLRLRRRAEILGDRNLRIEAEIVKDKELELFAKCDCSVVVTETEKMAVTREIPLSNIVVYPYTMDVRRSEVPFEQRRHLCFIGGYAHDPNVDAVRYFVRDVWPLAKEQLPADAKFLIVGADAPECIRSLVADDVVVTGYVDRLDNIIDDCRISVAPLRYGAGIKGKLVRTLAYGLPSVASSVAVEGMGLQGEKHVLVADDPRCFAEAIVRLFHDRAVWQLLQEEGYKFVEKRYSWRVGLETCAQIIDVADETWIARRVAARQNHLARLRRLADGGAGPVQT